MNTNQRRQRCILLSATKLLSAIILIFFTANAVSAMPSGQQVVNGQASFDKKGNSLTVTNSPNSIINWQGFSINANEAVRFAQQGSTSAVLNRVIGQDPSRILGLLQSNGRVFIVNPNGILFGRGAKVDVNGLVVSTLNISNQDFLAGKYNFSSGAVAGSIKNKGTITTPAGGNVYLIAPNIENSGIINTPNGDVILAAGRSVQLVDSLDPNISVVVSAPADRALNLGQIIAQSGKVGIYGGLISQKGIVNADSAVVGENGKIFFKSTKKTTLEAGSVTSANGPQGGKITIQSDTGATVVSGTVSATGSEGTGGDIRILGNSVELLDSALIDASGRNGGGSVLIGGDYQGKNPAVQNAASTSVGKDVLIRSDALDAGDGGKVIVWSDGDTTFAGNISARGGLSYGNGGLVETSGHKLSIGESAKVDTGALRGSSGSWLLDPNDFTIATSGGDITGTTLSNNLGTTDVTILSSSGATDGYGDINVNDNVSWTSSHNLALSAYRNIQINAAISHSGGNAASLIFTTNSGLGGGTVTGSGGSVNLAAGDSFTSNGHLFTLIGDITALQNIEHTGYYLLRQNIDATGTSSWNGGAGFVPIGDSTNKFNGVLGGAGQAITGLYINSPSSDYVGLFGYTGSSAYISHILLENASITGRHYVGELVGYNTGTIYGARISGTVSGNSYVGGLVGQNNGIISITHNLSTVTGTGSASNIGGLVGYNGAGGNISYSRNTGVISGTDAVGGLVGANDGSITTSYNTGAVSGSQHVGGLVGWNAGSISNSYSTGAVMGNSYVGGLVGDNYGYIDSSYSTGGVSGNSDVGGLVGRTYGGTISNSYSTGMVSGSVNVGGLVGSSSAIISGSYWDTDTSGQSTSAGGTGLTTADMMDHTKFTGWDFANTWWMSDTNTRPFLRSENVPHITNAHELQLMVLNLGASYRMEYNIDMSELSQTSGLWNTAYGFGPIGDSTNKFTGAFDGLGHTITGLYINRPTDYVGLFGYAGSSAAIQNVGLANVNVTGGQRVGGLVGLNYGSISDSYSTGAVSGDQRVGGLVGANGGSIANSYSSGSVSGNWAVGGLVGGNSGSISSSYSSAAVTSAGTYIGGLVGGQASGSINNSYSTGSVSGTGNEVGGLVGAQDGPSSINNSYSTGSVTGASSVGGLIGANSGTINSSYWDKESSGQAHSAGSDDSYGKTTAEMKQLATFVGWDFTNTWRIYNGHTVPLLKSFLTPLTITANNVTKVYDGTSVGLQGVVYSDPAAEGSANLFGVDNPYGLVTKNNVGIHIADLWSNQQGYDITVAGGQLTVNKAPLTITASTNTKTYDGGITAAAAPTVSGLQSGDTLTGLSETYDTKNAGTGKTLTVSSGYVLTDGNSGGNYMVTTVPNATGVIDKAALTITASNAGKTYGQPKTFAGTEFTSSGLQNSETVGSVTLTSGGAGATAGVAGSPYSIVPSAATGGTFNAGNYDITYANGSLTISPLAVTLMGSRTYDGTASAASGILSISNKVGSDAVTVGGGAGTLAGRNAGSQAIVSMGSLVLSGADAANYTFMSSSGLVTIDKAPLTIRASTNTKTYDGNTSAAATPAITLGSLVGDDTATLTESYADRNAGTGKTLTPVATINDGNSGNNYNVTYVNDTTGVINRANLTITALTNTKTYDGGVTTAAIPTVSGLQPGDTLTGLAETYDTKNAGTAKTLSVSAYTVNDGNFGNNYNLSTVNDTTGVINRANLTVTALTNTKTYDGGITAAAIPTVSGLQGTDTVTGMSEVYANRNAGTGKPLSVAAYTVNDGNFGNNYNVSTVNDTTGVINRANLTITAATNTKAYDGNTSAAATPTITLGSLVGGDTATLTESYADRNAGTGKTLTPAGTINDGNSGNNYNVSYVSDTTGVINRANLTITALTNTKAYDGNTSAAATPTITLWSLVGGDTATLTESYADRNAGTGKTLTPAGTINDGNSGNNYNVTYVNATTGVINRANLTVTAATNTKTYDGNPSAAAMPTVSGLQGTDTVTGLTEAYADRNVGTGKTLSVLAGYAVNDGNSGGNYNLILVDNITGVINPPPPAPPPVTPDASSNTVVSLQAATGTVTGTVTGTTTTVGSKSDSAAAVEGYSPPDDSQGETDKKRKEKGKEGGSQQSGDQKKDDKAKKYCN